MPVVLEPEMYPSVSSLFDDTITHHLAVSSVLSGTLPGRIYVDDPSHPTAAILIAANQSRVYVGGERSASLLSDVIELLYNPFHAPRYWFILLYPSNEWKATIEHALHGLGSASSLRQYYHLTGPTRSSAVSLPAGITLAQISPTLLEDERLTNRDLLVDEIHSESPSLDYFFGQRFGYCALDDRQLVGWCLAEYHYQNRYELGIETIESHQRRGIATYVASAVIQQAFTDDATEIGWDCWADNAASIATALKLGFKKEFDYPVITCDSRLAPTTKDTTAS